MGGRYALFLQNMLVNGKVVQGPYLSGNPALRSEIAQISGTASIANQSYNSMQTTLHKRFSKGFEYQVAFTWQHGISDSIGYYQKDRLAASRDPSQLTGRTSTTNLRSVDRPISTIPSSSCRHSSTNSRLPHAGGWWVARTGTKLLTMLSAVGRNWAGVVHRAQRLPADEIKGSGDPLRNRGTQLPRQRGRHAARSAPSSGPMCFLTSIPQPILSLLREPSAMPASAPISGRA